MNTDSSSATGSRTGFPKALGAFRDYLLLLARARLHPTVRARMDPDDIVQETLLDAHAARDQFRGNTSGEQAVWLRYLLTRNMANAVRDLRRQCRDVTLERSLDAALENSSARLEKWLAADKTSPIERAARQEEFMKAAEAIARLPEPQQEAVVLRHWHGWSLDEISRHMGRSPEAVAGLIRRAVATLRVRLAFMDPGANQEV